MPESTTHKRLKSKAAGKSGTTEKGISGGRRIDSVTSRTATEIERSGSSAALRKAARRLRDSGKSRRILQVPQKDMQKAAEAAKDAGVSLTVKNLSGTKRQYFRP